MVPPVYDMGSASYSVFVLCLNPPLGAILPADKWSATVICSSSILTIMLILI